MAEMDGRGTRAAKKAAPAKKAPGRRAAPVADLRTELRSFAVARPSGWDHSDWMTFLEHLGGKGHDVSDAEGIGRQLERERLSVVLSQVQGLGPKRVDALVGRYETLWSLRHADADEIARLPGMNRAIAEKVRQALA
jgi:hypothetical protein